MNDVTVGEIMDAFRVWQLNPTRLVGFFGWNHFLEDNSVKSASGAESENLSAISTGNFYLFLFLVGAFSFKGKMPDFTVTFFSSDHRPHTDRSTIYRNY